MKQRPRPTADSAEQRARLVDAVRRAENPDEAARLVGLLPANALLLPRWFGVTAGLCAALFVPWIVYLSVQLPNRAHTSHYTLLWVGFDIGMWTVLVALAVAAVRRSTWTEPLAVCAATLLVTDAWFDIVSADSRAALIVAISSAVLLELPAAVICAWTAQNAERIRRRAYRRLLRYAISRWHEESDR